MARKVIPVADAIPKSELDISPEAFKVELSKRIVGQPEALECIVDSYNLQSTGLNDQSKPICSLLFLGPTGTGKTRTVEAVAESLVGNASAVIKLDCAEYAHSHEIAKIIGSPPGYLGHRETQAIFSVERFRQLQSSNCDVNFILFDEIEKASDALWNLLLSILDKAIFTGGTNVPVSFKRCMVFMTSNVGAREMADLIDKRMGYAGPNILADSSKVSDSALSAAKKLFSPEFINRLDRMVAFRALSQSDLASILDLELTKVHSRILGSKRPFLLLVDDSAKRVLLENGFNPKYGARHLKRAIDQLLTLPLSRLISNDSITSGITVKCSAKQSENSLSFELDKVSLSG